MKKNIYGFAMLSGALLAVASPASFAQTKQIINKGIEREITTIRNREYETSGLGVGIDIVKANTEGTNYIKGTPVINASYLRRTLLKSDETYIDTATSGNNTEGSRYFTTTNSSEFKTKVQATYSQSASVDGLKIKCVDINAKAAMEATSTTDVYRYRSFYYYNQKDVKNLYTITLGGLTGSNTKSNLSSDYIERLEEVLSSNNDSLYRELFADYGTHLIKSASYGAYRDLYYTLKSEKYNFSTMNDATISSSIKGSLGEKSISASADTKGSVANSLSLDTSFLSADFYCFAAGANAITTKSEKEYAENYKAGLFDNVTRTNCAMTNIVDIVPLWRMLPKELDTTANVNKLKNAFSRYYTSANVTVDNFGLIDYSSLGVNFEKSYYSEFRNNDDEKVFSITDADARYQNSDKFVLSTSSYNISNLKSKGYTKAEITLELDMREVNHGYQEIFVYAKPNEEKLLWKKDNYEYGGSKKCTEYGRREFALGEISLDDLISGAIYVEYGAHGRCGDTWENKKPLLKVKFIRTQIGKC